MSLERQDVLATAFCGNSVAPSGQLARFAALCKGIQAPQWVGSLTIIEPVPEAVESMLYKVFCCSKVEPGIDWLQSAFICQISTWKDFQALEG